MAKDKTTGAGAEVEIDFDPLGTPGTYVKVGCIITSTPPPKTLDPVEIACLEAVETESVPGGLKATDFAFEEVFDTTDSTDTAIDTAMDGRATVGFKILLPVAEGGTPQQETFNGFFTSLAPSVLERDTVYSRTCTARRTTPIVRGPVV